MKKDPKVFIGHIIESIELIEHYSEKLTTNTFKKEQALQDAIIRCLEIIGEAAKTFLHHLKQIMLIFLGSKWQG